MTDGGTPGPGAPAGLCCPLHIDKPAVARCVSCGRMVCEGCRGVVGGRNHCLQCLAAGRVIPPDPGYIPPPPQEQLSREKAFPGASWGILSGVLLFLAALVPSALVGEALKRVLSQSLDARTANIVTLFLSSLVLYSILLVPMWLLVTRRYGGDAASLGFNRENLGSGLKWGFGLGVPVIAVAIAAIPLAKWLYTEGYRSVYHKSPSIPPGLGPTDPGSNPGLWFLFVVAIVVLAPVAEEIFFRGYLYPSLRNKLGIFFAVLVNGILFSAAHFDLLGFLPRFILGCGLALIYERSRNISGPICAHALYNGTLIILSLL